MGKLVMFENGMQVDFLVEKESFEGVQRVAKTVAGDIFQIVDASVEIADSVEKLSKKTAVLMATCGKSTILSELEKKGKIALSDIEGKREVYKYQFVSNPFSDRDDIENLLVIAGSDKRGTIYGMFHLSELCGVSPLIYFGDAVPAKKSELSITIPDGYVSKEPSVEFRGFFINDEWPAFGNWATDTFGGVNAKAYEKIFELVLRLKGNYLWPAMWNSSFSEEGPGIENAHLADVYGVVMGTSHHEPMCRAGLEWQNQYKKYGDDSSWNFISNKEAVAKFWEDGIIRNKDFENVITIGMRGENDSKLMPEDATLKDNIEVVKNAIRAQLAILKKYNLENTPLMIAIYKEVEDYYYGDDTCEGLKDWKELENVIFLLSDDNFGNLRNLPDEETILHKGGFGMYYHFDYHGAPISYEWTNCNKIAKIWEQMTQAYEFGVRKMWIVNVGDLKEMEYPLSFFMNLAYDFEAYGSSQVNKTDVFAKDWLDVQFGEKIKDETKEKILKVLNGYIKWNHARTPETMNETIYHPTHYNEGERVLAEVDDILKTSYELFDELEGDALTTYGSMIGYAASASLNLVSAWVKTGMNYELANRGVIRANDYADEIENCINEDIRLVDSFHKMNGGKWNHCLASAHTGFKNWDDWNWTYPIVRRVHPIHGPKAVIGFRGSDEYHLGTHWADNVVLRNDDLTRPDGTKAILDFDSRGDMSYSYEIEIEDDIIYCDKPSGRVEFEKSGHDVVTFFAHKDKFSGEKEVKARVFVTFDNGQKSVTHMVIVAKGDEKYSKKGYFVESQGYCSILAEHYIEKKDVEGACFEVIKDLGREHDAIKALPMNSCFNDVKSAPFVKYGVIAKESGEYNLSFYLLSRNPAKKGQHESFFVAVNDKEAIKVNGVPEGFYTEWMDLNWANGVLDKARVVNVKVSLDKGENVITVYAGEPSFAFEKLVVYSEDAKMKDSYFGPEESYVVK